ncbi:substrate-binding domain-containing protein [Candidatus Protofrankia californiensis]|uniref:substrate-binding domain-containing protein n=1 Tax=Candidatus Protofrankia californiensis TaxID=1839754 RepID=UPI0013EC0239|nr:substrate-binding domain-containing protein [Candidatus Protofrankia californiensis]
MTTKRKTLATTLTVLCAATLVACSSSGNTSSTSAAGKSIIYVAPSHVGAYVAVACGVQARASQYGMTFTAQYATTFSAAAQTPLINAAVAAHPAVLLVSAADTKALDVPLKRAASQGIKVITVANGIDDHSFLTSVIEGNNTENGTKTADLLAQLANGRTGDVAYIGFRPGGSAITDARQKAFEAEIKKHPHLHLITPTIVGQVDATTGAAATNAILSAHPNLLGIVGSFYPMSNGMAQALRERGVAGKVIALQMDSDPTGVDDIKNGSLSGLLAETFRDEGTAAAQQAFNAVTGKPVTTSVSTNPVVFTKDNVSDPSMQKYIMNDHC